MTGVSSAYKLGRSVNGAHLGSIVAPDDDPLTSIMLEVRKQLGAQGCYLTYEAYLAGEPKILFAKPPSGAVEAIEALLIEPVTTVRDRDLCASDDRVSAWSDVRCQDRTWSVLRVPLPVDGRGELALLALFDGAGTKLRNTAERAARRACLVLAPFMRLWTARAALRRRADGLASALDHSDVGVILLGRDSSVLFANSAARELLDHGDGIRRKGLSVAATALADALRLQVAIEHVATAPGGEVGPLRFPLVTLRRAPGRRPLMVSVLAPRSQPREVGDAAAMLYLIDPDEDIRPLLKSPCMLYGLSPVETRLACHLASGFSVDDAAAVMRIKPQTARTYLKQIFIKTDTRRQADLVRILLLSIVRTSGGGDAEIV